MKKCSCCRIVKRNNRFRVEGIKSNGRNLLSGYCDTCRKKYNLNYRRSKAGRDALKRWEIKPKTSEWKSKRKSYAYAYAHSPEGIAARRRYESSPKAKAKVLRYYTSTRGRLTQWKRALKGYGISVEQYNFILKKQKGVCAICEKPNTHGRRLCVDHNHKTGKVRGLLCHLHNRFLGAIQEDISILLASIKYLRRHNGN